MCHDLAGLISAFNNGAEILAEHADDETMRASSVELLKMSAEDASARLRVFRKLFGLSGGGEVNFYETTELLREYLRGFDVPDPQEAAVFSCLPAYIDKAALAFALIVHKAFPRKGTVAFRATKGGVTMRAQGKAFMLDAEERAALEAMTRGGGAPSAAYKNLAATVLATACGKAGARASAACEENALEIFVAIA